MPKSQRPQPLPTEAPSKNAGEPIPLALNQVAALERSVAAAIRHDVPARELVPLLRNLVRHTGANSQVGLGARLLLAEMLLKCEAAGTGGTAREQRATGWECAQLAKSVRYFAPSGAARARCWAISGLSYSLLGLCRAARYAYYQSLKEDPSDPICAHNLGHLLDTRLGQPRAALHWLKRAYSTLPDEPEIAASYAYALIGCGDYERAVDVLSAALGSRRAARAQVERWKQSRSEPNAIRFESVE